MTPTEIAEKHKLIKATQKAIDRAHAILAHSPSYKNAVDLQRLQYQHRELWSTMECPALVTSNP